jgi:EAL domain-containing protein (putative c-di-GMP-specific phosphodiesterase class I)/GGDEF domain-containing protein
MSDGKVPLSAFLRTAFVRLFSLDSKRWQGGSSTRTQNKRGNGSQAEAIRFRAVESIRSYENGQVSKIMAIAEVNRFSLLRRQIGHKLANRLIAELAERIQESEIGCELGRVGRTAVEFAFTAPSIPLAEEKLTALVTILEREIEIDGYRFHLPIVIGATEITEKPANEELIDRVEAAVTEAQEMHRKVRVTAHDADHADQIVGQLDMMRDLRRAMVEGGLELNYQPKLRARTNEIVAAEALLRWTHAEHGPVPTDKLITVAEASGAIFDLSRWVIDRAIEDQKRLMAKGIEIRAFINLSGSLVADEPFCRWAIDRLTSAEGSFGFEITETAVIDDPESALANLELFSKSGIRIAIDDYGSGLSSLAYLKQLPAHELKIDRMFIAGLTNSHRDPLLVRSSIDLAHALEMEVTAEGVDDPMTLSLLRVMGCDLIQGYLIGYPLPLNEFEALLLGGWNPNVDLGSPNGNVEWTLGTAAANFGKIRL